MKKMAIIAYTILMVFYGFYAMITSIVAYARFDGVIKSFERIVANLEMVPITSVVSRGTDDCSSGWDPLFPYNWKGT